MITLIKNRIFKPAWNFIKDKIVKPITNIFKPIIDWVKGIWEKIKRVVKSAGGLWGMIKKAFNWIKSIPGMIFELVGKAFKGLGRVLENVVKVAGEYVNKAKKSAGFEKKAACNWARSIPVVKYLCYYPMLALHLTWFKVQDLISLGIDLVYKFFASLIKTSTKYDLNVGNKDNAARACAFVRVLFLLAPPINLAMWGACILMQRQMAMAVDVLDLLLYLVTRGSKLLPDIFGLAGVSFRTKSLADKYCSWFIAKTKGWFFHGPLVFLCHAFVRLTWGIMSAVNLIWDKFHKIVMVDFLGVKDLNIPKFFYRTEACDFIIKIPDIGSIMAPLGVLCDLAAPLLFNALTIQQWVIKTVEDVLMGRGPVAEKLVSTISKVLKYAAGKISKLLKGNGAGSFLFAELAESKGDAKEDGAAASAPAGLASIDFVGLLGGHKDAPGWMKAVGELLNKALPLTQSTTTFLYERVPALLTGFRMKVVQTCDADGKTGCSATAPGNAAASGSLLALPKPSGTRKCASTLYTCTPRNAMVAKHADQPTAEECAALRNDGDKKDSDSPFKASDYAIVAQCVVDTSAQAASPDSDVGLEQCRTLEISSDALMLGMIHQVQKLGDVLGDLSTKKGTKDAAGKKGNAGTMAKASKFLCGLRKKVRAKIGAPAMIRLTLCNVPASKPWSLTDWNTVDKTKDDAGLLERWESWRRDDHTKHTREQKKSRGELNLLETAAVAQVMKVATKVKTSLPGLKGEWFKGGWVKCAAMPDFKNRQVDKTRVETDIAFNDKSFASLGYHDHFAVRLSGGVHVAKGGKYTFTTASDDGSMLWINGGRVVDNGGCHGTQEKHGTVTLSSGWHSIEVKMFEVGGGASLTVMWSGPDTGNSKQVLSYKATTSDVRAKQQAEAAKKKPAEDAKNKAAEDAKKKAAAAEDAKKKAAEDAKKKAAAAEDAKKKAAKKAAYAKMSAAARKKAEAADNKNAANAKNKEAAATALYLKRQRSNDGDANAPSFRAGLEVIDSQGQTVYSGVYNKGFTVDLKNALGGGLMEKLADMDGMPAILSQGLAQDWRFVLSKEKNGGYKFSMEMPKILDALRTIPPINSLLSTMDTTFGKGKFKFGLAIAPRGELEIFGASLKDLYDRLGVAEKFGVVMGKAKDMVNKVSEISGLDDNDNPVNKAVAKVSGAADTVVKYIDDAQKFLDDAEIKVKSTVLNFLDKFEKKSLKGLSDAIGKVTQFLADVKNKVGETDMAGMVDDALDTAKEALFDMAKDAVGTDTMGKVTNFLNELREYAKTFKAIVAMVRVRAAGQNSMINTEFPNRPSLLHTHTHTRARARVYILFCAPANSRRSIYDNWVCQYVRSRTHSFGLSLSPLLTARNLTPPPVTNLTDSP